MDMHQKLMEHMTDHVKWPANKEELMTTCNMHKDDESIPAEDRKMLTDFIEGLPDDPAKRYSMEELQGMMGGGEMAGSEHQM